MSEDYTPQQLKFVEVFLEESRTNSNYNEAGKIAKEAAGYSEGTKVYYIFKSVKELIIEAQQLRLAQMSSKLLNSLENVLDNPSLPGAKNVIAAASTLLDRGGLIKKEETTVNVKTPDGVLILPAKIKEKD